MQEVASSKARWIRTTAGRPVVQLPSATNALRRAWSICARLTLPRPIQRLGSPNSGSRCTNWWIWMDSNHRASLGGPGLQPGAINRSATHPMKLAACAAGKLLVKLAGQGWPGFEPACALLQPGSEPGGFDLSPTPHRTCSTTPGGETGARTRMPLGEGLRTSNAAR